MPHLITNKSERQAHPLYPHKRESSSMVAGKKPAESPEQTTDIPKTYDAIKSAAGADMKPTGKNISFAFF